MNRQETGLQAAVIVHPHATQHGVHGLRVKWRQVVSRVGSEAEQLLAAPGPGHACRIVALGAQRARHHATIAETMKDRLAAVDFDAPHDVGVMSQYHVGAGIDGRMRHGAFVRRQPRRRVHDSLVERDDHQ